MNTYPTLPWEYGAEEKFEHGLQATRATNGAPKIRILHDRRRKVLPVVHPLVTRAEMESVLAFYDANCTGPFYYTRSRDGVSETFTVLFVEAPDVRYMRGGRYRVAVLLWEL